MSSFGSLIDLMSIFDRILQQTVYGIPIDAEQAPLQDVAGLDGHLLTWSRKYADLLQPITLADAKMPHTIYTRLVRTPHGQYRQCRLVLTFSRLVVPFHFHIPTPSLHPRK